VFTRWILLITITPLSLMMKTNIVVLMMMWLIMTDPPSNLLRRLDKLQHQD